jgi:hypothetical protein
VSELEEDLRSTAEDLIADAERLKAIEQKKLRLGLGDPSLAKLADEADGVISRMAPKGAAQKQLAVEGDEA